MSLKDLETNVKNLTNESVVLFFMMPHATQCTVSESSRHRTATTGRENSFVQEVSSMKTCFTRSLFASKAPLAKKRLEKHVVDSQMDFGRPNGRLSSSVAQASGLVRPND